MIELPIIDAVPSGDDAISPRTRFWRSVSQLERSSDFRKIAANEFVPGASESPGGASRRQFLQVMGASMALAGLTACRRPVETIVPFSRPPEHRIPGVPVNYATSMPFRGALRPLLVESTDGRPTKIEGNPDHPEVRGASTALEQASLLGLYDPDRSRYVLRGGEVSDWKAFKQAMAALPASSRVLVMAEPDSSMTMARLRQELSGAYANVRFVEYDHVTARRVTRGYAAAFGRSVRPVHHFSEARVILSLDADFLASTDPDGVWNTRQFAQSRRMEETGAMNRLYAVESAYTITGGMADNRLRLKSGDIGAFASALAGALGLHDTRVNGFSDHAWVRELARELREAGPGAVVVAGDHQPLEVHTLVAAMNRALGAVGSTVTLLDAGDTATDMHVEMGEALAELGTGNVDVLVTLGINPLYDHPELADPFAQAGTRIHVGPYVDESAAGATWHVPETHFLEAWGDGRSRLGHPAVVQPLIAPLYEDAHSGIEVLGLLASGSEQFGYDLVRSTWRGSVSGDFEKTWRRIVHDGFLAEDAFSEVTPDVDGGAVRTAASRLAGAAAPELEVVVRHDGKIFDGRYANNAWLQELPDSVTKVVWDNVAAMSPATAERLGVTAKLSGGKYYTDTVSIDTGGASVELPVWIQPGIAEGSIQVTTGYGRSIASTREERKTNLFDLDDYTDVYGKGAIATGVGSNVSPLMQRGGRIAAASVTRSGSGYMVASTQDHGAIEEEGAEVARRGLFRMATVEEYRANPDFVKDSEPAPIKEDWSDYPSLWEDNHPTLSPEMQNTLYSAQQWGMVIDLNTCSGCNACVVACQSENNIQVVGKEEVARGREMHWIRLDRYFVSGDGASFEEPQMVLQPVPCMHCENAPCEQVCPVAATVHSPDGTNQMIYNRCIGTRYCANNCPYKVRRFNFYNWTKTLPTTTHMAQNPNVTVRSRGVMEKCSYCIQRIREVNKQANVEERSIQDGEVVTACQQACPAEAITFGNLADPESRVSQARRSNRRYEMLAELSVKPRTSYLGRIRNPNPTLISNDNA